MIRQRYRYQFADGIDRAAVEAALALATLATESLHGESQTRLETRHWIDPATNHWIVDGYGEVVENLSRLFVGFLLREFGGDCFTVQRVELCVPPPALDGPGSLGSVCPN